MVSNITDLMYILMMFIVMISFYYVGLSSSLVVAGISVAITVPVTAIITAIITIIIMYLLCIKHNKQSEEVLPSNDYETPIELDNMTCNSAYGQYSGRASYRVQCY